MSGDVVSETVAVPPVQPDLDGQPPDFEPVFTFRRSGYEHDSVIMDSSVILRPELPPAEPTPDLPADPHARHTAAQLMRAIVEVLDGRRPLDQLYGLATLRVIRGVQATCGERMRSAGPLGVRLLSVHLFQPHENAVEAAAVCRWGARDVAIAGRFDHAERYGWRCTDFRLLAARGPDPAEQVQAANRRWSAARDQYRRNRAGTRTAPQAAPTTRTPAQPASPSR